MKKFLLLLSAISLLSLGGCDMFRRLAGRPTAKELEQIKVEQLLRQETEHLARIDSLKRVEKALNALEGVTATVDLAAGTASITLSAPVEDQVLVDAVTEAGYQVVSLT